MPASEEVVNRVSELKDDVNNALARIERTIDSMRQEFRTDFVTKGEYNATIEGIKNDLKDMKESTRWTVGTVIIPSVSVLVAVGTVVVDFLVR